MRLRQVVSGTGNGRAVIAGVVCFGLLVAACSPRASQQETTAEGVAPDAASGDSLDGGGGGGGNLGSGGGSGSVGGSSGGSSSGGVSSSSSGGAALPEQIGTTVADQIKEPETANVCGNQGIMRTGRRVQFPWAIQCLKKWSGDNGGETAKGVYRDRIRVAYYISRDPVVVGATKSAGGCGDPDCARDYVDAFTKWFEKYYQTYGRNVEVVFIEGGGSESNENTARDDARRIASIDPPVFAALNGPGQAGTVYAEELKAAGIMCFCTVSLPEEFYQKMYPYVHSTLMSSTQAYIHRAEYIGKRLAGRKAKYAGNDILKARNRSFGLVYFENSRGDYKAGVDFFQKQLARYGVKLKKIISYTNIEGCQIDAQNMVNQLMLADVTSVIFSGDPICPIHLTKAAQAQEAKWEWIVTGSALTDTNNFGRLYDQNQWSRAFGVSMLQPDVKNVNDYWFKMYQEIRGTNREPKEEAPVLLSPVILLYTGIHLAGPNLTPKSLAAGMAKAVTTGGTVTLPQRSYGPKKPLGVPLLDTTSYDDMVEVWWDPDQTDPNGKKGAYWFVRGGHRYLWGEWPRTEPNVFVKKGAVYGYDNPPDQSE